MMNKRRTILPSLKELRKVNKWIIKNHAEMRKNAEQFFELADKLGLIQTEYYKNLGRTVDYIRYQEGDRVAYFLFRELVGEQHQTYKYSLQIEDKHGKTWHDFFTFPIMMEGDDPLALLSKWDVPKSLIRLEVYERTQYHKTAQAMASEVTTVLLDYLSKHARKYTHKR